MTRVSPVSFTSVPCCSVVLQVQFGVEGTTEKNFREASDLYIFYLQSSDKNLSYRRGSPAPSMASSSAALLTVERLVVFLFAALASPAPVVMSAPAGLTAPLAATRRGRPCEQDGRGRGRRKGKMPT